MGAKRPNWTIEDSPVPPSPANPDRGYQSDEWINREGRPRAGAKIPAEREREVEVRRVREMDRKRDIPRDGRWELEREQWERERFATSKGRAEETEWKERDRKREERRYANGRVTSMQDLGEKHREREREKGDTFPRTRRHSNERERQARHSVDEGRDRMLDMGQRKIIVSERERERERARRRDREIQKYREIERQRENERARVREEMKINCRKRPEKEESDRIKERGGDIGRRDRGGERDTEVNDQQVMRVREVDRERDRSGNRDRGDWFISAQKVRSMEGICENFSDQEEWSERHRGGRSDRHRHTKSEGDSDGEKDVRKEQDSVGVRNERRRNKGDVERDRIRERRREERREVEMQRRRQKEKDTVRLESRGKDREWMTDRYPEQHRERAQREGRISDRPTDEVRGTQYQRKEKEVSERLKGDYDRERADSYTSGRVKEAYLERVRRRSWEDEETTRSRRPREEGKKLQEEAQSSRVKLAGSNEENEQRKTEIRERFEDLEKENTSESGWENKGSEEGQGVTRELQEGEAKYAFEKKELETETERERENPDNKQTPRRKMWLEPRSWRERTEFSEEEFRVRERARASYAQRYKTSRVEEEASADSTAEGVRVETLPEKQCSNRPEKITMAKDRANKEEGETEDGAVEPVLGTKVDLDVPQQTETENVANNTERIDREEGKGSDRYGDSEGEWEDGRGRVTPGDDGFVTVSSDGDEDDKFEDCEEFWHGGGGEDATKQPNPGTHQREGGIEAKTSKDRNDRTVTVFCLVGQTLPRSGSNLNKLTDQMEQQEASQYSSRDIGSDDKVQGTVPITEVKSAEEAETGGYGGEQTERAYTGHGLAMPEEEFTSSHEEKPECDVMTKEITSPEALEVTGSVAAKEDAEPQPLQPCEISTHTKDCGHAQRKMTDGENRGQGEQTMKESYQLEETWSMAEERKRYSAAPHVKWAKNVISEILGSPEEGTIDVSEQNAQTEQPREMVLTEAEGQLGKESPASPVYGTIQKTAKHQGEKKCVASEHIESVRTEDPQLLPHPNTKTHTLVGDKILIQVEQELEGEDAIEPLDLEKEWLETGTDDDDNSDGIFPSPFSSDTEVEKEVVGTKEKEKEKQKKKGVLGFLSSSSFQDLGNEARMRRRGIRKTLEKEHEKEGGGGGRDRRTRVFASDDEYDDLQTSWGEAEMSNFKGKISRTKMRNSKFYNSQLYQEYNEVAQNREILHQSHSDSSVFGEVGSFRTPSHPSPCSSPSLARRVLPPLPNKLHPHSLAHTNSLSRVSESPIKTAQCVQRAPSPRLSFASSPMLWQDLPGVRNNPELSSFSEDQRRLQEVRFEVVTSEASYCTSLDIVVEHFVKSKYLNSLLTPQDKRWLFSRLNDVRAISHSFFSQLDKRVDSDTMHFTVCDIIVKHCPCFRSVYVPYLTNQSYQDKTYQRLMNENPRFRLVVEKLEQSPKCQRLPFRSFLILPFQRITRLKLLVQNILKKTAPKTTDEAQAIKALQLLEKMIQESNDSISQMKSIESLVSLNAKVDFECKTLPLISQFRRLVREGQVTELRDFSLKDTERSIYLHLFNDYLFLSLPRQSGRFTVIDHAPISELRAENCRAKLYSLQKNLFLLHMSHKSMLLRTETQADKLRWISALSRPHPEIDLNAAQDDTQVQCIRAFVAQQPDELSLEKADVLLVHQQSSDGWVEGTRLSDRHRGWVPESHLEIITSKKARQQNLMDTMKITAATATG